MMKKLQVIGLSLALGALLASSGLSAAETIKAPLPLSATPGQGFTQDGLKRIDAFFACLLYTSDAADD